jgi:hypothetical protein
MKIEFYKARHIWVNGQNATWTKSDKFDVDIFEELKNEYEELKGNKKNVINFKGKTLFLFYRSGKDFTERPITEITAFLSNKNFNDNKKIYQELDSQIQDEFEDKLDYTLNIDNNYLNASKKSIGKVIGGMMSLVLMSIVTFIFMSASPTESITKKNDELKVNDVNISEKNISKIVKYNTNTKKNEKVIVKKEVVKPEHNISIIEEKTIKLPEKKTKKKEVVKVDFKEFSKEWNEKIRSLKKRFKINLDKYLIDDKKDILLQVNSFIDYKKGEKKREGKFYKKIRNEEMYKTLKTWIEKREKKLKKNSITQVHTTSELRKKIKEKLNFRKPFSKKTIETIISWNEFGLFFEKNKTDNDKKNGFKSCKNIKERVLDNYKFMIDCTN